MLLCSSLHCSVLYKQFTLKRLGGDFIFFIFFINGWDSKLKPIMLIRSVLIAKRPRVSTNTIVCDEMRLGLESQEGGTTSEVSRYEHDETTNRYMVRE